MQGRETFVVVLQWIITATAIVGNGLVIYLITFRQRLHSKANWFVLSLAAADLFVGASFLPYYRACKAEEFCYQRHIHWLCVDVFLCASVTNLCLLTVDRYIAIVKPLKYLTTMTQRRVMFGILAAWCFPAATALLPLSWTYLANSMAQRTTCWKVFIIGTVCVYGIIPCLLLPLAIVRILLIARRCRIERCVVIAQLDFNYSEARGRRQSFPDQDISSTKLIVAIVILFLICYLFGVCVRIAAVFGEHLPPESVYVISSILILTNSAANPVAYGLLKKDFRRELLRTYRLDSSPSDLALSVRINSDFTGSQGITTWKWNYEKNLSFIPLVPK